MLSMLTWPDKILIGGLVVLTLLSLPIIRQFQHEGRVVVVEVDGELVGNFSLEEDRFIPVDGKLGTTRVEIVGNRVRVLDSPCPLKLCVKSGTISKSGEALVCLPNGVVIRIEGGEKPPVDAVSR